MKFFTHTLYFFFLLTMFCFAQWVQVGLEDKSIKDIAVRNSNIFAITSDSAVYRSTNNGITWLQIVESSAIDIAVAPTGALFMVAQYTQWNWEDSLYRSTDNGNTWVNLNIMGQLPPPIDVAAPNKVTISPTGFAYCDIIQVFGENSSTYPALSTDDGLTWSTPGDTVYGGELFDFRGPCVITCGYRALFPHWFGKLYLSSDNGQTWIELGGFIGLNNVLSMCLNGNIIFGTSRNPWALGLFLTKDSCHTWTQVSSLLPEAGISIESGGVLVGTDSLGVFLFSDNGDSLSSFNEGLSNLNTHTLSMDNNDYIYLGTDNGVWRRPLSEINYMEELPITLPSKLTLSQNYPNPFNPSTTLRYSIPNESKVIIKVYDILGKEIETLVSEEKPAGTYELTWNAADLPSGVYFYQLKAVDPSAGSGQVFVETKKMILLK